MQEGSLASSETKAYHSPSNSCKKLVTMRLLRLTVHVYVYDLWYFFKGRMKDYSLSFFWVVGAGNLKQNNIYNFTPLKALSQQT